MYGVARYISPTGVVGFQLTVDGVYCAVVSERRAAELGAGHVVYEELPDVECVVDRYGRFAVLDKELCYVENGGDWYEGGRISVNGHVFRPHQFCQVDNETAIQRMLGKR